MNWIQVRIQSSNTKGTRYITTTEQPTTKPCEYFMRHIFLNMMSMQYHCKIGKCISMCNMGWWCYVLGMGKWIGICNTVRGDMYRTTCVYIMIRGKYMLCLGNVLPGVQVYGGYIVIGGTPWGPVRYCRISILCFDINFIGLSIFALETLLVLMPKYSGKLGQYHGWWCPGFLCRHRINSHDIGIDNVQGTMLLTATVWTQSTRNTDVHVFL